ncbi:MAG TPA: MerR family transcriptional regulator [Ideonella sp.]|nr:MerR family transcriptional regulator [Ideonella sp.]
MEDGDPNRLPAIPAKRYFTIGEVSELCGVKPYVLRYWEQEFTQLRPMKRRGNRRYYQHHEVLLIRRIRDLLYDQGFTISGARNRLVDHGPPPPDETGDERMDMAAHEAAAAAKAPMAIGAAGSDAAAAVPACEPPASGDLGLVALPANMSVAQLRAELRSIRAVLAG